MRRRRCGRAPKLNDKMKSLTIFGWGVFFFTHLRAVQRACYGWRNMNELLTTKEACALLGGIDKATLLRWRDDGKITPAYVPPTANGALLWNRADVEKLK